MRAERVSIAVCWIGTDPCLFHSHDPVSMVDGSLLDKLCELGQMVRRKTVPVGKGKSSNKDAILADAEKPFGGIQVILTGDFHQVRSAGG